VQEQPDLIGFIEADLDEVVARPEAAELQPPVARDLVCALGGLALLQRLDPALRLLVVDRLVVDAGRQRDRALDRLPQRCEVTSSANVLGGELGADRDHAAADVHADRRRDDRSQRRNNGANRRALAQVRIRHQR
jgi:hypothetical protein